MATVAVGAPDGTTSTFIPLEAYEALMDERDELRRLASFVQMHLFERDTQAAVDLLYRHGYGPDQAKALRAIINSVRA